MTPTALCRFAEALRLLLSARTPAEFEHVWSLHTVETLGWRALASARTGEDPDWEAALDEVDGLLLRLLDRVPVLAPGEASSERRVRTFRLVELERLQHATAADLVGQRYGTAGLGTVVADQTAPLARRYFAFLALGERHPPSAWPLFARYLTPTAHHAFVGTAAEAARFYPEHGASLRLVALFDAVRRDQHLRSFLSPRILESLFVLEDPATLPFFRGLLTTGHTHAEAERCEVTRALVMVRRFTGRVESNAKFADGKWAAVARTLDAAEGAFERRRQRLTPVLVI
ncbi:MAG: hypothetical protein PVF27_00925 [Gemmatimonadales bacterium]|jgi:hypothetical protein